MNLSFYKCHFYAYFFSWISIEKLSRSLRTLFWIKSSNNNKNRINSSVKNLSFLNFWLDFIFFKQIKFRRWLLQTIYITSTGSVQLIRESVDDESQFKIITYIRCYKQNDFIRCIKYYLRDYSHHYFLSLLWNPAKIDIHTIPNFESTTCLL